MIEACLPRIPPIGFLGLGAMPTCAGASSRRTVEYDSNLDCVARKECRGTKAQLRVAIGERFEPWPTTETGNSTCT